MVVTRFFFDTPFALVFTGFAGTDLKYL